MIKELLLKPIVDTNKFDKEETTKKRTYAKISWYNWLINYILNPIMQTVNGAKRKTRSHFKIKTTILIINSVNNVYQCVSNFSITYQQRVCSCKETDNKKTNQNTRQLSL